LGRVYLNTNVDCENHGFVMHAAVGDAHVGAEIWLCKNSRTVNRCTQPPHQDNSKVTSSKYKILKATESGLNDPRQTGGSSLQNF
jgi:hypothetical protein